MRCGYCYKRGHNRRTCPERRKEARNNPNGYTARRLKEEDERAAARARKPRSCSYCHETGHNKRSCPVLKERLASRINENKRYRQSFINLLHDIGLGPGTLVKMIPIGDSQASKEDFLYFKNSKPGTSIGFVVGVDEKRINCNLGRNYNRALLQVQFANGTRARIPLPRCEKVKAFWNQTDDHEVGAYERVSWVIAHESQKRFTFTQEFITGVLGAAEQVGA